MPNYETLDEIADSHVPLLAIVSLGFIVVAAFKAEWRMAGRRLLTIGALLTIAYGLMFLDRQLSIWSRFGLDYSIERKDERHMNSPIVADLSGPAARDLPSACFHRLSRAARKGIVT